MDLISTARNFIAVIDNKNFSAASRRKFVSVSYLSKQVKWLEEYLNTKLIKRTTRHLELTPHGKIFYAYAKNLLSLSDQAKNLYSQNINEISGDLTIAYPTVFGRLWIMPAINTFLKKHPKIKIKILVQNNPAAILDKKVDVAISSILTTNSMLKRQHLYTGKRGLFASPKYLKNYGTPETLYDLKDHNCLIDTKISDNNEWHFANNKLVYVDGNFSCDSSDDLISAAIDGVGITWCFEMAVIDAIKSNKLAHIKLKEKDAALNVLLYYSAIEQSIAVKAFINYIIKYFKEITKFQEQKVKLS